MSWWQSCIIATRTYTDNKALCRTDLAAPNHCDRLFCSQAEEGQSPPPPVQELFHKFASGVLEKNDLKAVGLPACPEQSATSLPHLLRTWRVVLSRKDA